jgi:hypothetical protein
MRKKKKIAHFKIALVILALAAAVFFIVRWRLGTALDLAAIKGGDIISRIQAFKRAEMKRTASVEEAGALVRDADPVTVRMGLLLLARAKDKKAAFEALVKHLETAQIENRYVVIFAIGELGDKRGIDICRKARDRALASEDHFTGFFAQGALAKLRGTNPFPRTADRTYGKAILTTFTQAEAAPSLDCARKPDFRRKLLEFAGKYTSLATSAVSEDNIKMVPGSRGSTYNKTTNTIKLRYSSRETLGILVSHFIHELAVINLGGQERYGTATTNTSFTHDLSVLTELAYSHSTCISLHYMWGQSRTCESLWGVLAAEEMIARITWHRRGAKTKPFIVEDATLFEKGVLENLGNFHLKIEVGENISTVNYVITPLQ